ncbi:MAG: hypothetical protein QNK37_32095 [Acidobacteriota bacterium]|nr:hypothetical protein [Acidobacteriota bacterium]
MDQYACAVGELIYLDPMRPIPSRIPNYLGAFILGDSGESKDTQGILGSVKAVAQEGVRKLKKAWPRFDLRRSTSTEIYHHLRKLTDRERVVMEANISDRDLLTQARILLTRPNMNHEHLGRLLDEHHRNLSHKKRISTAKIERMLQAAREAGVPGGKINGSGGGGCMFAYAPDNPEEVAKAIESAGGKAHVVKVCPGLTITRPSQNP